MTLVSDFDISSFLSLFIEPFSFFKSVSKYENKSSKFFSLSSFFKFSFVFSLVISKNILIQQILQISSISGLFNSLILAKTSSYNDFKFKSYTISLKIGPINILTSLFSFSLNSKNKYIISLGSNFGWIISVVNEYLLLYLYESSYSFSDILFLLDLSLNTLKKSFTNS